MAAGIAAALAGITPAAGLGARAPGLGAGAAGTTAAATTGRAASSGQTPSRIATLPTGDLVGLSTGANGAPATTLLGSLSGGAGLTMRVGRATYVIPRSVQDVVGSKLDPQLFNATRIAERSGGRTPVTVSYASASAATAVPGVEVTQRTGLSGRGFITPASSRALGRALTATSATTLYAGVTAVKMADPGNPATRWPMHTLTVRVIGRDGRPAAGVVGYLNVTQPEKGSGFAFANYKGIAKISVPAGTYQLIGSGFDSDLSSGYLVGGREFTVTGPRTASIDLRAANQPVSTRYTKALDQPFAFTSLDRTIVHGDYGASMSFGLIAPPEIRVEFAPTVGPLHGEQALIQSILGASPVSAPNPYQLVTLGSRSGRLPAAPVRFVTTDRSLTAAKSVVHGLSDYSRSMISSMVATETGGIGIGTPLPGPRVTRYMSAGPGLFQSGEVFAVQDWETMTLAGWQSDQATHGTPGRAFADPWLAAPLHSRFLNPRMTSAMLPCPSCIGDGTVAILSLPMSDANLRHVGNPDLVNDALRGTYAVLADGRTIDSGTGFLYFAGGAVPAGTKVITARQSATRSGSPFLLTTRLTTEMSSRVSATIPLPDGLGCIIGETCRALPMLSADYSATADIDNRLAAGRQTIGITVNQVGRATAQGVRSVKAWMSYDGRTWTAATVTGSGASYRAAITVPRGSAGARTAGLKLAVTDAAGSTLTETIDGAFLLPR